MMVHERGSETGGQKVSVGFQAVGMLKDERGSGGVEGSRLKMSEGLQEVVGRLKMSEGRTREGQEGLSGGFLPCSPFWGLYGALVVSVC